jgi:hypothetical protein
MSLDHHQQRELHRIESRLLRSDPQLAAKLAMFGRAQPAQPTRQQTNPGTRGR